MIRGTTALIAHLGYPTATFKAPMIYNPYFEKHGIDAVVMPLGVKAEDYADVFKAVFSLTNIHGALITMPHKVTTVDLLDEVSTTVKIAGSCNAVLRRPDGTLIGDMFDGAGFVRGVERKGRKLKGAHALVVGAGGVGSGIAASLAGAPEVREIVRRGLRAHNGRNPGASTRITRVLLLTEPPSIDANEITDKGYVNQRAVLVHRAALVERLFAEPPGPDVIVCA